MSMIVVLGAAKSATSALFYSIQGGLEALVGPVPALFEPKNTGHLDSFDAKAGNGVIKVLLSRYYNLPEAHPLWERVTHRVFIYRDPRDNIVSHLMHRMATRIKNAPPALQNVILDALSRKQNDPPSVSLIELINLADILDAGFHPEIVAISAYSPADFLNSPQADRWLILTYEDFVEGRLLALNDYLAFPVDLKRAALDGKRLRRTVTAGDWINWFTPDDYEALVDLYADKLIQLGFDPAPYTGPQKIRTEACLGYVAKFLGAAYVPLTEKLDG